MAFSKTWDESVPAGTVDANTIDTIIQDFKTAVRERLQFGGMYFPSTHDELSGEFSNVRMAEQAAKPTAVANKGFLYVKDVSGIPELFYEDDAGSETQLTTAGALNPSELADYTRTKTGDWIQSSVTTARTGWTNVSATYSNKFMRINATPLTTGGADTHTHGAGSYAGPSHTHTATTTSPPTYPGSPATSPYAGGANVHHTHSLTTDAGGTGAVTGTSASGDNVPAFVQTVLFQKD